MIEPEAEVTARRRFTLLDAMVMVAFMAVGCLAYREIGPVIGQISWADLPFSRFVAAAMLAPVLVSPIALSLSLAVITLRFLRPRPPLSLAWRQPGILGVGFVAAVVLLVAPCHFLTRSLLFGMGGSDLYYFSWCAGTKHAGIGGLGIMLTLRLTGALPPRGDWVDGLGRVLSWYWIVASLLAVVVGG